MDFGTDITTIPFMQAHDASEQDYYTRVYVDRSSGKSVKDLAPVEGRENIGQALIQRLLTPRGSLKSLGHTNYGSRIHELIGRRKTAALRNLCRLFVLEVVAQEPRVEDKAHSFHFDEKAEQIDNFIFTCEVKPVDGSNPLAISLEVSL